MSVQQILTFVTLTLIIDIVHPKTTKLPKKLIEGVTPIMKHAVKQKCGRAVEKSKKEKKSIYFQITDVQVFLCLEFVCDFE